MKLFKSFVCPKLIFCLDAWPLKRTLYSSWPGLSQHGGPHSNFLKSIHLNCFAKSFLSLFFKFKLNLFFYIQTSFKSIFVSLLVVFLLLLLVGTLFIFIDCCNVIGCPRSLVASFLFIWMMHDSFSMLSDNHFSYPLCTLQ